MFTQAPGDAVGHYVHCEQGIQRGPPALRHGAGVTLNVDSTCALSSHFFAEGFPAHVSSNAADPVMRVAALTSNPPDSTGSQPSCAAQPSYETLTKIAGTRPQLRASKLPGLRSPVAMSGPPFVSPVDSILVMSGRWDIRIFTALYSLPFLRLSVADERASWCAGLSSPVISTS